MGRTILELSVKDPSTRCSFFRMCCFPYKKKGKVQIGNMVYDGEEFYPEEFQRREVPDHDKEKIVKKESHKRILNSEEQKGV